jgi:site-specific DNA-methyltransferase (adenine-specific)
MSTRAVKYAIYRADAFAWLRNARPASIHAVVADPPYGIVEYLPRELAKRENGRGGIWRLPHNYDGHKRSPVPRFTVLGPRDHDRIRRFFRMLAKELNRVLVPGAHVFLASNSLVSHIVSAAFVSGGFEKRGEIVRVTQTLRGGDRPKNAHHEFSGLSVIPRSSWEPWLLFRKPCEGRVQDNLRKWFTGALRRPSGGGPFKDLIHSSPARGEERRIAPHPSLKPQRLLRQIVRASLPLGTGIVLDPFMGGGSTIAAALAVGYDSVGVEIDPAFFRMAERAIPRLAKLEVGDKALNPKLAWR